jgi:hypothetical protein
VFEASPLGFSRPVNGHKIFRDSTLLYEVRR